MSVPYYEVRNGNRGGRDQFSWEDVRLVSYKDREMYLGHTSKLGFLDKGGKWRKRDWYAQEKEDRDQQAEIRRIQDEDEHRMNVALGLVKEVKKDINPNFTKEELKDINKKITNKNVDNPTFQEDSSDDGKLVSYRGLGIKTSLSSELVMNKDQFTKLQGEGVIQNSKKDKKDKKNKKDKKQKKDKKEKKIKKHKKEKNHKD